MVRQKTPFDLQLLKALIGNFEVFLQDSGVYIVVLLLVAKSGAVSPHAIAVDRDRNLVMFGQNDGCDDQITLQPCGGDLHDVGAAKEGLLRHFPQLKDIIVAEVWRVQVKTKRLSDVPHAALKVWMGPPVKVHHGRKRKTKLSSAIWGNRGKYDQRQENARRVKWDSSDSE